MQRLSSRPPRTLFNLPPLPSPTRGWPLLALLLLFLVPGILSHSPWKIEDATHFGIVWRAAQDGQWLLFQSLGSQLPEPPLFYWLGRLLATFAGGWLTPPDAIRLASLVAVLTACVALHAAGRELAGKELAPAAPLALVSCLGFLVQSHETQPMLAVLAGVSALLAGLASTAPPLRAATWIGAGGAILLLSDGLALLPAVLGIALLAQAASDRPAGSWQALGTGVLLAVALAAPWYTWLAIRHPELMAGFLAGEAARYANAHDLLRNATGFMSLSVWFTWPALPLALTGLWRHQHAWRARQLWLGLVALLCLWLNLSLTTDARQAPALLLLPPLALLAVAGIAAMRRGATNGFDWFSRLTFTIIVGLVWLGWCAITLGLSPKLSHNFLRLSPGFAPELNVPALGIAALLTLAWLWLIVGSPRSPLRSLAHWAAGISTMWALIVLLWLPWIEHMKSYESVARTLRNILPAQATTCIATTGLGEPQQAALEYFLGQRLPELRHADDTCRYLLVQGRKNTATRPPSDEWRKVWEGSRPGDRSERLSLYHRG